MLADYDSVSRGFSRTATPSRCRARGGCLGRRPVKSVDMDDKFDKSNKNYVLSFGSNQYLKSSMFIICEGTI